MESNIKMLMQAAGIKTYQELSYRSHVPASDLSQVIHGYKRLFPSWRTKLAAALGVDAEDILIPWDPTPGQCEWTNEVKL